MDWNKVYKFFEKRVQALFFIFIFINILAILPTFNLICDIFSHFKLQYFYISLFFLLSFIIFSVFTKKKLYFIMTTIILAVINFIDLSGYYFANPEIIADKNKNHITIGLFNVLTQNTNYESVYGLTDIKKPDIVILQETDDDWINALIKKGINKEYPYSKTYTRSDNFGISMFSKYPMNAKIELWDLRGVPVIKAEVTKDNKTITIYAVHTLPPISKEYITIRNIMLEKINKLAKEKKENLIIAGDFNTTTFSYAYKKYIAQSNLTDSQKYTGSLKGTWCCFHPKILHITLEHILSSKDIIPIKYETGFPIGSDHLPVFIEYEY